MLECLGVVALLSYFFYRNILAVIPLSVFGVMFYRKLKASNIKKNRENLEKQFKECILSVSTAIRAGYSVENAFRESESDMKRMFGEESFIVRELSVMRRGLVMNVPLENILLDMAERSGSTHIEQFARVFEIANRSGGKIAEIIRTSAELISRDIDARTEMQTVLSGRRLEQNIMKIVPFGIVIYIDIGNKGYFDSLYGNLRGIAIMTGCLAVYVTGFVLGERILGKLEREM